MGTRSLTYIYEKEETTPFLCIYNQYDGYIEGLGLTIAKFINSKMLVNGISGDYSTVFNGMGCLAAQLVVHMKGGKEVAGNTYIMPPLLDHDSWQEYEYHIWPGKIKVKGSVEYEDTWENFLQYCLTYGQEEEEDFDQEDLAEDDV